MADISDAGAGAATGDAGADLEEGLHSSSEDGGATCAAGAGKDGGAGSAGAGGAIFTGSSGWLAVDAVAAFVFFAGFLTDGFFAAGFFGAGFFGAGFLAEGFLAATAFFAFATGGFAVVILDFVVRFFAGFFSVSLIDGCSAGSVIKCIFWRRGARERSGCGGTLKRRPRAGVSAARISSARGVGLPGKN